MYSKTPLNSFKYATVIRVLMDLNEIYNIFIVYHSLIILNGGLIACVRIMNMNTIINLIDIMTH